MDSVKKSVALTEEDESSEGRSVAVIAVIAVIVVIVLILFLIKKRLKSTEEEPNSLGQIADVVEQVFTPHSLVCPEGTRQGGLFCYEKCTSDEKWDGTHTCYKNGPSDWPGGSTLTHLQHDTKYSTVGTGGAARECADGDEKHHGLCYTPPAPKVDPIDGQTRNYQFSSAGLYRLPCPNGMRWDGTACWQDYESYGRGVGYISNGRCENKEGVGNCERNGLRYYPKCRAGYTNAGCCICTIDAKPYYNRLKSVIGTIPTNCVGNKEKIGGLCYPRCPDGYERRGFNLEYCTSICPPNFTNIGIGGCQKPTRRVNNRGSLIDVGICPESHPIKRGELCYAEIPNEEDFTS